MEVPETQWTQTARGAVAWQEVGGGPIDLIFVPGFVSHVELWWETPATARFLGRLAGFSRLVVFDKLGTGLSDPLTEPTPVEQRLDEIAAVMDAAGMRRAALLGYSEGGTLAALFAATYPDRVSALALMNTTARFTRSDDWPAGWGADTRRLIDDALLTWGSRDFVERWAPSILHREDAVRRLMRFQRMSASPGTASGIMQVIAATDIRPACRAIQAPTLVAHATGDRTIPFGCGRDTAALIPGARFVPIEGDDHLPWLGGADAMLDAVEEFLTGARPAPEPDRVLATVLFVDIVGSTTRAATVGDRRWRELLEGFLLVSDSIIDRWRGRRVKSLGDGLLATFDGPGRAVSAALEIREAAEELGLQVRSGLHTGECEMAGEDIAGLAVHIGARVGAAAGAGDVLATSTVRDLTAGSGLAWEERGPAELRGVPGEWRLYAASSP